MVTVGKTVFSASGSNHEFTGKKKDMDTLLDSLTY